MKYFSIEKFRKVEDKITYLNSLNIKKLSLLDWYMIVQTEDLSMEFIEKYKEYLIGAPDSFAGKKSSTLLTSMQNLSLDFIKKNFLKLDKFNIYLHQNLTFDFLVKYNEITIKNLIPLGFNTKMNKEEKEKYLKFIKLIK
jgi:hypothetical protein